jgi:hypothetical protein
MNYIFVGFLEHVKKLMENFLQTKMKTVQVFIKTEQEEKEDVLVHQTQFLLEETPCVESTESER